MTAPSVTFSRFFLAAIIVAAQVLSTAHAAVWMGMDANLQTPANWSPVGVPGNAEPITFNGQSTFNDVTFATNFEGAGSGVGTLTLTSAQTTAVTINSTVNDAVFRLAGGSGILIDSGAGPLTIGGGATSMLLNLGGADGTSNFTNNSANTATLASNATLNRGAISLQTVVFGGTGNWQIDGQITNLQGVNKTGTGTLTLANTLTTQNTNWDEGTITAANGFTTNNLRVGYDGKAATATVTTGPVNIGTGATNTMRIGYKNTAVTTPTTSGTLNLATASSVNINVGALDVGWLDTATSTANAVTGVLNLSTSGTNTVRANSLRLGFITGGSISSPATTGTLNLGNTNNFFVDTFTIGGDKAIGTATITPGGILTLQGNLNTATDLNIGTNLSANTSTAPTLSHLNLTGGTFNATLDEVLIGAYLRGGTVMAPTGSGSGKGSLTFDAGTVTANLITLARSEGVNPLNTTGQIQMRGGTLTVAQGIVDGGGTSTLLLDGGTATVSNGVSVDKMRVGYNGLTSTTTVQSGAVRIGSGSTDNLEIGLRVDAPNTTGTLNLQNASSVTINVGLLDIAHVTAGSSNATVLGTLNLSTSGLNSITADMVRLGQVDGGTTGSTLGTMVLGQNNTISTDTFFVGKDKARGMVSIAAGGTLTLGGKSTAAADLYIGNNLSPSTGTNPTLSELNLTGGTINATLDEVIIGNYNSGGGGSGKGLLTFGTGLITANSILLANSTGTNPLNTTGTINMNGGELRTQSIARGAGIAAFNFNSGLLKVTQFGDTTRNFNLNNTGTGTLAHGLGAGTTIGTTTVYGNYTQGDLATLSFDLSLDSGADTMFVFGDVSLDGTLALNTFGSSVGPLNTFTLIHNEGTNAITGTFNGFAEGHVFALDFGGVTSNYTLSYFGGASGRDVVLMIPEPSRSLLLLSGLALVLLRRKRNS
ncbi:PEP-CTERM sorting domain-containing protein [Phragmitibacter flavus]|uniref:PEP-CTERM sorting domain-containing protein n=1 Tax=Phragmitibacter flavus TaxID=2576071 RepID=A0A5R8KL93_9BACT|nr:PEP-CTERM sorting domain-containing protein [Phragmitibacter flavus]TLD72449.1 PEP-CTERM sorting domain-containing protein [Phragmitibacter flavus]